MIENTFLTLESFVEINEMKNLSEIKPGDVLSVLPEYGAGSVKVKDIHYDRNGKIDGVITDRGIFHPSSFKGIKVNV